ncbi:MAG: lytic murein transglycosylase [Rickettsiales bacterium]|nr:lytic murein transglycosylase [Rickettsiales bacterium]
MRIFKNYQLNILFLFCLLFSCVHNETNASFDEWKASFKTKALNNDISLKVFDSAFKNVKQNPQYQQKDNKQYNRDQTFAAYYLNHVNNKRISRGKETQKKYLELLNKTQNKFGVQQQYILALWGIETDYGKLSGDYYVIESLANLAYNTRRSEFFEKQLIFALKMIQEQHVDIGSFYGSWAGANGQCQFMPSSFYSYAYDGDYDGVKDIWHNPHDIITSIANYLYTLDWDDNVPWGYEIKKIDNVELNAFNKLSLFESKGVKRINNKEFTDYELKQKVKIIKLDDRFFVTFNNFEILWDWNNSNYFATTVGIFADQL